MYEHANIPPTANFESYVYLNLNFEAIWGLGVLTCYFFASQIDWTKVRPQSYKVELRMPLFNILVNNIYFWTFFSMENP